MRKTLMFIILQNVKAELENDLLIPDASKRALPKVYVVSFWIDWWMDLMISKQSQW